MRPLTRACTPCELPQVYGTVPGTEDGVRYYGGFYGGGGKMFAAQLVYVLALIAWVGGLMGAFFALLKVAGIFRVNPALEDEGADASHYGGSVYHGLISTAAAAQPQAPFKAVYPGLADDKSASDSDEMERLRAQVAQLASRLDALDKA